MFGFSSKIATVKHRLGIVEVSQTPAYITVDGIGTYQLLKDMYGIWGSNALANQMFTLIKPHGLKMRHFFGLDFLYICQSLYDAPSTRTPRRVLRKVIEELKAQTWLGTVDRATQSITDPSGMDDIIPFPPKPYQSEFVKHYGKMVPAYRLRGYLLDAQPGTGKTLSSLLLEHALKADRCIILSPKNAVNRVWEDTIANLLSTKRPYWVSVGMDRAPTIDDHFFIVHYERIEEILNFVKVHKEAFHNLFVIVDESHNFNRMDALRTQQLVDLSTLYEDTRVLWMSGTPLLAMGKECIPFLKSVDPLFDEESEERFRKIYGKNAKRANEILRNRLGHLKYHVASDEAHNVTVETHQIQVKIPHGERYTLDAVGAAMKKYSEERTRYYESHFKKYRRDYDAGIEYFQKTLKSDQDRRKFIEYQDAFSTVSGGFDPVLMKAEAMLCNSYEQRVIIPTLPQEMKATFRNSRSVVKYLRLKVLGECLGSVLGRARIQCHLDMVEHIDFSAIIDDAKKKTLIFTSYVEVLEKINRQLGEQDYQVATVYGSTNKDLASIVKGFYKDADTNPLTATYQSLSTAVPLTAANTLILVNQPFRSAIREQTIARAARLGQDEVVKVYDTLLDTGAVPNISTRSNDIMAWSQAQVQSILGVQNVDLDTLSLECKDQGMDTLLTDLGLIEDTVSMEAKSPNPALPMYLYHGSAYKQDELMPGYLRSGTLVRWDETESNEWLYTSDSKEDAIMLGISSAIEKKYPLDRYHYDEKKHHLTVEVSGHLTQEDIHRLEVWLYTIKADVDDGWVVNYNPKNGIDGEYKTQGTVDTNLLRCERVDVRDVLRRVQVKIKRN